MTKIETILGIICDLVTPNGQTITGYFCKPKSNIWFTGRISISDYRSICKQESDMTPNSTFSLFGAVNGNTVYIENAVFGDQTTCGMNPDFVAVNIFPNEIAIGCNIDEFPMEVERIEASFPELNWFLGKNAVSCVWDLGEENCPTKFNPFNTKIAFDNMSLTISRTCNISENKVGLKFSNINEVIVGFNSPVHIMEAVRLISCVRTLLCFLADDYVALPSELVFPTSTSPVVGDGNYKLADKIFWLNDSISNKPQKSKSLFRIGYSAIADCFPHVWSNWYAFWNNPVNQPLTELFVQIISHKSLGLNRFLNLCQTLEVYSAQCRDVETKKVLKDEREAGITTDKKITLRIRLKDLFSYHQDVFPQKNDNSQLIAYIRNYYTHYDPQRKEVLEAEFDDIKILASRYEGILHLLLLATVYKEIGVPVDKIKDSIFRAESRFGIPTECLFAGPGAPE